ncbi:MAG TPA: tRNA preQ1(34) S-adenosylmethionine ribosyltransferase-isomerase QueA [Phycisphaerales bacterium]|nr:tRNA preQ1(34) S-adenosylmethionine ribosyltransferase-isomerase QueA [Phycisphaerales bacterium]
MKTELLDYTLPDELIAQKPADKRGASRLLVLNRTDGALSDRMFTDLPSYLRSGDCLALNNTKVLPARFYAQKPTGARLEGLFVTQEADGRWQVLLKNARKLRPGDTLILLNRDGQPAMEAVASERLKDGLWHLKPACESSPDSVLGQIGFAPLPPYIKRTAGSSESQEDLRRYQTVYAAWPGAVAAPTAGLHFDKPLLERIEAMGVRLAYVTLHVGIGTFRPVQTDTLDAHPMHEEYYHVSPEAAATINAARRAGGRIIAVGTTSVRTLESVADAAGTLAAASGRTRLFIMPGYTFKIVDAMVTNFHLPRSTLLALAAAFAELDTVLGAYRHAVAQKYRFYSYGDAMLII